MALRFARCVGFIGSYHDLVALVRDFMLPNPDIQWNSD